MSSRISIRDEVLGVIAETLTIQEITQKTTQENILVAIDRNPRITRVELAAQLGVSHDTVKYHLRNLVKGGFYGSWVVIKSIPKP